MESFINENWSEERPYCIYRHTSPSGKVYIGQTKQRNLKIRWGYEGGRYKGHTVFTRAIKKYGWDNFKHEIIKTGLSQEEANEIERELIEFYKSLDMSYNMAEGGLNRPKPTIGNKFAQGLRRIHNPLTDEEHLVKPEELEYWLSDGWELGTSRRSRRQVSESMKGNRNTEGHICKESTKLKISETSKGRILSKESREKIGNASSGRVPIHNEYENRYIKSDDLESYLGKGYKIGFEKTLSRKIPLKRIWITNGTDNKTIDKIRLKEFEEKGWWRGKTRS